MIAVFVFLEWDASRQPGGSQIKDKYRKLSIFLARVFIFLLICYVIYMFFTSEPSHRRDGLAKFFIYLVNLLH